MSEVRSRKHKLPVRQFAILALVRFSEPIALTSVFPYLPAMIEGLPDMNEADVGFWTGMAAAIFSLAQCVTAIPWGQASDKYGRKPILLLGVFNTMVTMLIWGFSTSLPMALAARALSGAGNGNVGILRTMVAELCPWKELQPRAFSIMPLIYSVGSVIGPALGGALSNPYNRRKGDSPSGPLLWRFPYLLPNLVAAGFFLFGITIGILFLQETLTSKKDQRDPGLVLGKKLTELLVKVHFQIKVAVFHLLGKQPPQKDPSSSDYTPVLADEETVTPSKPIASTEKAERPSYRDVLSKQTVLCLLNYWLLAMHNTAWDQIVAVYMHHPRMGKNINDGVRLPLSFNRGLGMGTSAIGIFFTINGFAGIFFQFVLFPPIARKYGSLTCLRWVLHIIPFIYLVTPFSTTIENDAAARTVHFMIWLTKSFCSTFSFPCSTIILTNTAPSLEVLGTINGIATSVGAIGRAIGPTLTGALFTWGVKHDFIAAPFMLLFILGLITWVPLYFMVEGDGFGDDDEVLSEGHPEYEDAFSADEDDDDETEVSFLDSSSQPSTPGRSRTGTMSRPKYSRTTTATDSLASVDFQSQSEHEDELAPLLDRQNTRGSQRLSRYASIESSVVDTDEEESVTSSYAPFSTSRATSGHGSRAASQAGGRRPSVRRRRSSAPIGTGTGFRRISSNLGLTRSGLGTGRGLDGS